MFFPLPSSPVERSPETARKKNLGREGGREGGRGKKYSWLCKEWPRKSWMILQGSKRNPSLSHFFPSYHGHKLSNRTAPLSGRKTRFAVCNSSPPLCKGRIPFRSTMVFFYVDLESPASMTHLQCLASSPQKEVLSLFFIGRRRRKKKSLTAGTARFPIKFTAIIVAKFSFF